MSALPLNPAEDDDALPVASSEGGVMDPILAQLEAKLLRTAIPAPQVDREKLFYACGEQAALAEMQQKGVAAVTLASKRKENRLWPLVSLVTTSAAILLGVVLMRQQQELVALRGNLLLAERNAPSAPAVKAMGKVASEKVENESPPTVTPVRQVSMPKISARELAQIYSAPRNSNSFLGMRREMVAFGADVGNEGRFLDGDSLGGVSDAASRDEEESIVPQTQPRLTPLSKWEDYLDGDKRL